MRTKARQRAVEETGLGAGSLAARELPTRGKMVRTTAIKATGEGGKLRERRGEEREENARG